MERFLGGFTKELGMKIDSLGQEVNIRKRYGIWVNPMIEQSEELKSSVKLLLRQDDLVEPYADVQIRIESLEDFNVRVTNTPIYIYGLYTKMSREMSQTEMPKRLKKGVRAVADFTKDLVCFFSADKVKFISSGREDADVRMIGGRPFILQVQCPKRNLDFSNLKLRLHKEVCISELKRVTSLAKVYIHENQENRYKTYQVLAYSKNMHQVEEAVLEISQDTPLRVLHRRANLTRKRIVKIIKFEVVGDYAFMRIRAQAGTYIKEFVTGNFGRTFPSITSILGNFVDCLELDVLSVEHADLPKSCILHDVSYERLVE